MRKQNLLALSAGLLLSCFMSSANAQVLTPNGEIKATNATEFTIDRLVNMDGRKINCPASDRLADLQAKKAAPCDGSAPVTEVEGGVRNYAKESAGITLSWGMFPTFYEKTDAPAEIVFGDDGCVYFHNIISGYEWADSYVKGTLDGNTITVQLPQMIQDLGGGEAVLLTGVHYFDNPADDSIGFELDPDLNSVTFTISEDGVISLDVPSEETGIGYTYQTDGFWVGYVDYYQIYRPSDRVPVTLPESAMVEQWSYVAGDYGYFLKVAYDGDDIYIGGLSPMMPDGWIKGSLDGDKATFSNNQYVGTANDSYFVTVQFGYETLNENGIPVLSLAEENAVYVMTYDRENKTLRADDTDMLMIFNTAPDKIRYITIIQDPRLNYQPNKSGTPREPTELGYNDLWMDYYGYSIFGFKLSMVGQEGTLLDTDGLYYRLYVNGEQIDFDPDVYTNMPEYMAEVPFYFTNDNEFFARNVLVREIGIYNTGIETLGVQMLYYYNDEETEGPIATMALEPTGVDNMDSSSAVCAVEYFDLTGRSVSLNAKGVMIKRTVLSDGTIESSKIVR